MVCAACSEVVLLIPLMLMGGPLVTIGDPEATVWTVPLLILRPAAVLVALWIVFWLLAKLTRS